jgi:S-formylglutathione hydrolase FrmB
MKTIFLTLHFFLLINFLPGQGIKKGKVVVVKFLAPSIQGNRGGEDPMRRVTIYLPAGYETSNQRYPTIYYLHGFVTNDSLVMNRNRINELMDTAILSGRIHPMILVMPNSDNNFGGSLYTNSSLTGNWADYIAKEVVDYIDRNYRTIPARNSRGLTGHSMGGNGAFKISMLFPDVFGAVYALSPVVTFGSDLTTNPDFKAIDTFRNEINTVQLIVGLRKGEPAALKYMGIKMVAALARAYSPNEEKTFLSATMPVTYVGDSAIVNKDVLKKWEANSPLNMIESHLSALKSLNALKFDWGRNDPFVGSGGLQFSKKLEAATVAHFSEEYLGGHSDKQGGLEGRLYTEMLPFFDTYLKSDAKATAPLKLASVKKNKISR